MSERVRWYTLARRFPQLVARTPDGTAIPGGPYTVSAFVCAGLLAYILLQTMSSWAPVVGGTGAGFLLTAVLTYATAWGVTRLPLEGRNPFSVGSGFMALAQAPRDGVVPGRRRITPKRAPKARCPRGAGVLVQDDSAIPTQHEETTDA